MNIILIFIIAVSLSMDAFSLSLAYGTLGLSKKEIINQHNKQKEKKQEIAAISTHQTMIETTKIEVVSKKKIRKKIYELEGQMKFF